MTIIFLLIFLLLILSCRIKKENNEEYLSKDYTNAIKGFFMFFVFIRHFIQYNLPIDNKYTDSIGIFLDAKGGQLLVTMFLFYSGYGIMESFKKKGQNYIKSIPKNRILKTLINFDAAVIIYMILSLCLTSGSFSIKKLLLALIGWDNFGNSNWYIFCILALYFISYISLKSFSGNKAVISMTAGTLLFTFVLSFYKSPYWYNTAFCYVLGCAYSANKEKIEEWLNEKELVSFIYLFLIFIIGYNQKGNIIWYHIHTLAFVLMMIIITRKVRIKNKLLSWMGQNLFPLYIFQRLPMIILNNIDFMRDNPYILFVCAIVATFLIAVIYNRIIKLIGNLNKKN